MDDKAKVVLELRVLAIEAVMFGQRSVEDANAGVLKLTGLTLQCL